MRTVGRTRISKATFYLNGGLSNTHQFRKMIGGVWTYWYVDSWL